MKTLLTFNELGTANAKRCGAKNLADWSITDWGCAIGGEAGELLNKLKKLRRGEDIPLKDVADEMADVIIYIDLLATKMNIDLPEAVRSKFNEVTDRVTAWQMDQRVYL